MRIILLFSIILILLIVIVDSKIGRERKEKNRREKNSRGISRSETTPQTTTATVRYGKPYSVRTRDDVTPTPNLSGSRASLLRSIRRIDSRRSENTESRNKRQNKDLPLIRNPILFQKSLRNQFSS